MKLTRQKLRLIIEQLLIETKENFKKIKGGRKKAEKVAKYGDPKKKKDLSGFLKDKFGGLKYCKTCAAYDVSNEAIKAGVTKKDKSVAFCHAFGFSCKKTNSCTGYTPGGPKK